MKDFFRSMMTNTGVAGEILVYLWRRKMWWLIPMIMMLLMLGLLLVFASSSGVLPFLYPIF